MEVYHHHHLKPMVIPLLALLSICPTLPLSRGQPLPITGGGHNSTSQLQTYVVHVRKPEHLLSAGPGELEGFHQSFLPSPTLDSGEPRMVHSYERAISGFSARLTPEEVEAMAGKEGFLFAHPDEPLVFESSWSPQFLRLSTPQGSLWNISAFGKEMVVAVIDSGINPDHSSFDDTGMPTTFPSKWKGRCNLRTPNRCNNKIIGAKNFDAAGPLAEPLDNTGHGTFVASVVGANFVPNANVSGLANGAAAGMSPGVHLSVYRADATSGLVAAFDEAIKDGVDVISVSLSLPDRTFYENDLAIASLTAVENGIFVTCAAGNGGPQRGTVRNDAPWVLTVGASTMDRALRVILELGNGEKFMGESLEETGKIPTGQLGLTYPGANSNALRTCSSPLNGVAGMAVLCLSDQAMISPVEQGTNVRRAGGATMILMNNQQNGSTLMLADNVLPTVVVSNRDSQQIMAYLRSAGGGGGGTVTLRAQGTIYAVTPHPTVASISGRGPSAANGGVLKPDIVGPGINIIGASSKSSNGFVMMSGTSVATAHLASIATMLKKIHSAGRTPWSTAAVRSAIMTTSNYLDSGSNPMEDETGGAASAFAMGAGHVHPTRANDPGLVYDIQPSDYIRYLCGLGYTQPQLDVVARRRVDCSREGRLSAEELNYPSISVTVMPGGTKTVTRTVKNEGAGGSTYRAELVGLPPEVAVAVNPDVLQFRAKGEALPFTVSFSLVGGRGGPRAVFEGQLKWVSTSGRHVVRSPSSSPSCRTSELRHGGRFF